MSDNLNDLSLVIASSFKLIKEHIIDLPAVYGNGFSKSYSDICFRIARTPLPISGNFSQGQFCIILSKIGMSREAVITSVNLCDGQSNGFARGRKCLTDEELKWTNSELWKHS